MSISQQSLDELGFIHTHNIVVNGNMPTFDRQGNAPNKASVYLWVAPIENSDDYEILYVGKAGYGVYARMQQHIGGFRGRARSAGGSNRAHIVEWLSKGRKLMVFARVAETQEIFGSLVSNYSTEEEALAKTYKPRWNRASFAGHATEGPDRPSGDRDGGDMQPAKPPERRNVSPRDNVRDNRAPDGGEQVQPSASELFHESIKGSAPAQVLAALVMTLADQLDGRTHHTYANGCDLRVEVARANPHPREQNVLTMSWRPTQGYFSCDVLLEPNKCVELGISKDEVRLNANGPLRTGLKVEPGNYKYAFLAIAEASIKRFRDASY